MTLVKMAVGNKIGADVKVDGDVLAPQFGSIVLETFGMVKMQTSCWKDPRIRSSVRPTDDCRLIVNGEADDLDVIVAKWQQPLEGVFPVRTADFRDNNRYYRGMRKIFTQRATRSRPDRSRSQDRKS